MNNNRFAKSRNLQILASNFYFVCFYSLITRKNYEVKENDN